MSREEILFDAITGIREDLIEWAQDYRFQRRAAPWRRYLAAAGLPGPGDGPGPRRSAPGAFSAAWAAAAAAIWRPRRARIQGPRRPGGSASPGEGNAGAVWPETFTATVLEVHEAYLLVEPAPGEAILASADRWRCPSGICRPRRGRHRVRHLCRRHPGDLSRPGNGGAGGGPEEPR